MNINQAQMRCLGKTKLLKNIQFVTNRVGTNFLTMNPDGEKCKFMDFFSLLFIFHSAKWRKTQYCQFRVILVTPVFSLLGYIDKFKNFCHSLLFPSFPRDAYRRDFPGHLTRRDVSLPRSLAWVSNGFNP